MFQYPDDLLVREPCMLHSVRLTDTTGSTNTWKKLSVPDYRAPALRFYAIPSLGNGNLTARWPLVVIFRALYDAEMRAHSPGSDFFIFPLEHPDLKTKSLCAGC